MKSKYLVLQIDIGPGTQWGKKQTINPIREVFMPSVKKYCQKFNYDYLLVKKSNYQKIIGEFDFLPSKNKHYAFERYFHFNNDYDYIIYLDNDVYVYLDAEPLPEFKGVRIAREPESSSSILFREANNLDNSYGYFNSGVIFCDNSSAKILQEYMIGRAKKKIKAKGKNTDNMMVNEFILKNKELFLEIGSQWNYMPFFENSEKINNPNFFHFVGIIGKEIINRLQDKKISIEFFLNDLKKIK